MTCKRILNIVLCVFLFVLAVVIGSFSIIVCYEKAKSFITTDYNLYLENGTYFEQTASLVMPSKNVLDSAKIVHYQYEYNYGVICEGNKMLRLIAIYPEDDFHTMKDALEEQYLMQDECYRETFLLDDEVYYCYIFYNNSPTSVNAYAMAYSIDINEKRISYILYGSFDIQVMSAKSALSSYYGEGRITSAP